MPQSTSPNGQKTAAQKAAEARAGKVALPDGLDPASVGVDAARFVYQYRQQHRTGPTWRELAEHLHPNCRSVCGAHADRAEKVVPRVHADRIVRALAAAGWVQPGRTHRSLTLPGTRT